MEYFFLSLFIGACAGLLLWGVREPTRIYQYPFLMGAIFSAFLIPQAIALTASPGTMQIEDVNRTLFMGALCMLMVWIGYQFGPLGWVMKEPVRPLDEIKVLLAAYLTMAISLIAGYGMQQIPAEEIETGTGLFTILAFFSGFAIIAFPVLLMRLFNKPGLWNLILAIVAGYPIYSAMLFAGRRSQTAEFFVLIALVLFFERKYVPTKILALGMILLTAYLIPVFAVIREQFWPLIFGGDLDAIPFTESMNTILEGDILELRNAAAVINGTLFTGEYGYGTGYWDALVFRYVPGQLLGFDLKESLQFNWGRDVYNTIGYEHSIGSTYTAIADTFQQFGYFGSLFFVAQGYLFKNLWVLANQQNSLIPRIAYIALIPIALVAVTHGSVWFVQGGLIIWLLLYLFNRYARL